MPSAWEAIIAIGRSPIARTLIDVEKMAQMLRAKCLAAGDDQVTADTVAMHARVTGGSAGEWFRCGMPRISIGHRHAAALMATNVPADVASGLQSPWPAFGIIVPSYLIRMGGDRTGSFDAVALLVCINQQAVMMTACDDVAGPRTSVMVDSIDRLGELAHEDRGFEMLSRLAIGVMFELNEKKLDGSFTSGGCIPRKTDARGLVVPTTFTLTRDVRIDARSSVRDYVKQGGTAPTVRSMVRGHWRRHIVTKGSEERRWCFVEPYWKGAIDAPIALRDHVLSTT